MFGITAAELPAAALLARYRREGDYTDCWSTVVSGPVSHVQYVEAFYTTWVFKLERWILGWLVKRPSTDAQARELAAGQSARFAAWSVEDRAENQLLLSDFRNRTRSWLSIAPESDGATRLYFGSAVVADRDARGKPLSLGWVFTALVGFHKAYSIVLLAAARRRCAAVAAV